jgi:cytoskeletal protein CcmA (bactofilin family)
VTHSRSDRGHRRTRYITGALVAVLTFGFALPVLGARTQSDLVLIRAGDVIEEDLYAAGNGVQVDGTITGDLVASALDTISISGRVEGSVVAIASRVVVSGEVTGSLRVVTPDLEVSGTVGGDVLTAAWRLEVAPEATIGRDVLAWAWDARTLGSIGRNVEGQQRELALGGEVAGDVEVTVGRLTVLPATLVEGDVVYTSDREADVDASAVVDGSLVNERSLPVNVRIRGIRIMIGVLTTLLVVALGLAIVWAGLDRVERAAGVVRSRPLAAFAWGVGVLSVPVAVAVVMGLIVALSPRSAGIPLLGVFAPVVLGMLSLLGLAALTTPVPVATAVGSAIRPQRTAYARFVLGFVTVWIAAVLPWVGGAVLAIVLALGLGAWILSGVQEERVEP